MKTPSENDILKFVAIMGGANVRTPQNIKDLKMAELDSNEKIEDSYIYVKKAFDNLDDEEITVILKRIYLDYVKPTIGFDLMDYFKDLSLKSIDYLVNHKDERNSFEASLEELKKLTRED